MPNGARQTINGIFPTGSFNIDWLREALESMAVIDVCSLSESVEAIQKSKGAVWCSIPDELNKFNAWLLYRRYSTNTTRTYFETLRSFLIFLQPKAATDATNNDMVRFVNDYILKNGYSLSYQNQVVNACKLYFKEIAHGELERKLPPNSQYQGDLALFLQILLQKKDSKNKIYSIYEPEVACISKGKEHKKYEFGNKASFAKTDSGVLVAALGFRDEYDGHTLKPTLEQVERLTGKAPKKAKVDRGYRGNKKIGETEVLIPSTSYKSMCYYQRKKLSDSHKKRAGIEPVIGHLKTDHRLNRNFYKGVAGDNINIMLSAAAFNLKRMMNRWKFYFCQILERPFLSFFKNFTTNSSLSFSN